VSGSKPEERPWRIESRPRRNVRPAGKGSKVYAVEQLQRLYPREAWILLYEGTLEKPGRETSLIRVSTCYGLRYDPAKSRVSSDSWACTPKRRGCYSQVEFGGWGGKHNTGDPVPIRTDRVFAWEIGVILLTDEVVRSQCGT